MTLLVDPPATGAAPVAQVPPARGRPRWALPGLVVLLAGTAVVYLWELSASG